MTTSISPWGKFGISRAAWYRYGKPATKGEYEESRLEHHKGLSNADDFKRGEFFYNTGIRSLRTWQRSQRVLNSELGPYVAADCLSIAAADRILGNPILLARTRKRLSQNRAKVARK
jgi:hypothetical protein